MGHYKYNHATNCWPVQHWAALRATAGLMARSCYLLDPGRPAVVVCGSGVRVVSQHEMQRGWLVSKKCRQPALDDQQNHTNGRSRMACR